MGSMVIVFRVTGSKIRVQGYAIRVADLGLQVMG